MDEFLAAAIQLYAKAYLVDEGIRCEKVAQMHLSNLSNHIKSYKLPRQSFELALQLLDVKIHTHCTASRATFPWSRICPAGTIKS